MTTKGTGAERQARYRKHRKGDHSLCIEGNCTAITPAKAPPEPEPEQEFGQAGQKLWDGTLEYGTLTDIQRVLLREMCRMTDRLELLHSIIADEDPDTIRWASREARQTALATKNIAGELRQSGVAGGSAGKKAEERPEPASTHGRGPGIGNIAQRATLRLASPTG